MRPDIKTWLRDAYKIPDAVLDLWTPRAEAGDPLNPIDKDGVRTLHFFDPIDSLFGVTEKDWVAALDGWEGQFNVLANSPGGSAYNGVAIMNVVAPVAERMTWDVVGICASAATLPMMKCKGSIRMGDMTSVLVHEARGLAMGTAEGFRAYADELERLNDEIVALYAGAVSMDEDAIRALMGEDRMMGRKEAIENGFADERLPDPETVEDDPENVADEVGLYRLRARMAEARSRPR